MQPKESPGEAVKFQITVFRGGISNSSIFKISKHPECIVILEKYFKIIHWMHFTLNTIFV